MGNKQPKHPADEERKEWRKKLKDVKVCVIGPEEAGKTVLSIRSCEPTRTLPQMYIPTIGQVTYTKNHKMAGKMEWWDTTGNERCRVLLPMYMQDSAVILICLKAGHCQGKDQPINWIMLAKGANPPSTRQLILVIYNKDNSTGEESEAERSALEEICTENDCFFLAMDVYRDDIEIFNSKLDEMLSKLLLN